MERRAASLSLLVAALLAAGCDAPVTQVVVDNGTSAFVYRLRWHAVDFTDPLAPGASSDPASTVPASATPAWAILAPDYDPATLEPPTSLILLQSREGLAVSLNHTLTIRVDDAAFAGECPGSPLDQADADFLTTRVFADVFAGRSYDAATCTVR